MSAFNPSSNDLEQESKHAHNHLLLAAEERERASRPTRARRAPVSYIEIKDSSEEESQESEDSGSEFNSADASE